MTIAVVVTGLLAALVGGYLLTIWVADGGLRPRARDRTSRFSAPMILGHGTLAASGLGVWVAYLVVGTRVLAWTAVGVLVAAALLGATMFGLWISAGHGRSQGRHARQPRHAAEDRFPPPAVLGHGVFAAATVVLAVVSAWQTAG